MDLILSFTICISAIIGSIIGSWCTFHFSIKKLEKENEIRYHEEKYSNLISYFRSFYESSLVDYTLRQKFLDETNQAWLFASDEVIKNINEVIDILRPGAKYQDTVKEKIVGKLILSMRKDIIGKNKTSLKTDDFKYLKLIKQNSK